jgi:hypothetical protein
MGNGGNISNDFCLLLNYDVPTGKRITQTFIDQIIKNTGPTLSKNNNPGLVFY